MNTMKWVTAVAWSGILMSQTSMGLDLSVEIITGSDSNPNRLSDNFEVDPGIFGVTEVELSHMPRRNGFYFDMDGKFTSYLEDEDAVSDPAYANEARASAKLGYKWRPRIHYGRARFTFELYGGLRDGRYVRRSSGELARSLEGIDITDRFDATWSGFETAGRVPISEEADFIYDLYFEGKQYEEILGTTLSNLNYQQSEIDFGFEKRIWPRVNLLTMLGYGVRFYEDRRAKNQDGADLPGTELEFTYLEAENVLEYLITDRWKWQIGLDVDLREDNEQNYYDTTQAQLFTRVRYRNGDWVRFLFYASYINRKFDNIELDINNGIDEEDLREKEGFRGKIELQRTVFVRPQMIFDLILGAEINSFTNSDPNFTYDRTQTYVGLRWRPN